MIETDITEDKLGESGYILLDSNSLIKEVWYKEGYNKSKDYYIIRVVFWLYAGVELDVSGTNCNVRLSSAHGQSVNMSDITYFENKLSSYKE